MSLLEQIPLFCGVEFTNKSEFENKCTIRKYNGGDRIFDYEEPSTEVGFILSGSVRVFNRQSTGKEIILGDLGVGNFVGEMSAIDGLGRSADVIALTSCELLMVPSILFCDTCFNNPELSRRISQLFIDRIRELNTRLFEHHVLDAKYRLYSELLRMAKPCVTNSTQLTISPPPFLQDVSYRVGCHKDEITREINLMIKNGLLEKSIQSIIITKPEELKKLVDDAYAGAI